MSEYTELRDCIEKQLGIFKRDIAAANHSSTKRKLEDKRQCLTDNKAALSAAVHDFIGAHIASMNPLLAGDDAVAGRREAAQEALSQLISQAKTRTLQSQGVRITTGEVLMSVRSMVDAMVHEALRDLRQSAPATELRGR